MTRKQRTSDEVWALDMLLALLSKSKEESWTMRNDWVDRPDAVLESDDGVVVACEITSVSLPRWFEWKNAVEPKTSLGDSNQVAIPRETDLWLLKSIESKSVHVDDYLENSRADEAWLLVHSGNNSVFDLFEKDDQEAYDIPLLVDAAKQVDHPFTRIYVVSANWNKAVRVFPYVGSVASVPDITNPGQLKMTVVRSFHIQFRGVGQMTVDLNSQPTNIKTFSPLDVDRIRTK